MSFKSLMKSVINAPLRIFDVELVRKTEPAPDPEVVSTGAVSVSEAVSTSAVLVKEEMPRLKPQNNDMLAFDEIYDLRTSMEQILQHCKDLGLEPATVIDVGVAYGTPALYSVFSESKHLLMEPIEEYEPDLKRICSMVDAEYVLAAASSESGSTLIYVGGSLDGSSIMLPPGGRDQEEREIRLVKLDDVCNEKRLQGPYVLKVDVQGAELLVLEGAANILSSCELVILEVSFFNFRPDMPDIYDVISYMKNKGFVVYEIYGGHNRPLDGARAQTDIAFVKEKGMFREVHRWSS